MQRSGDTSRTILRALEECFRALDPTPGKVVVALSGGPDSSVLTHALRHLSDPAFDLHAVHVNHHLRGDASHGDESWVRMFCRGLGVPLSVLDGSLDADDVRSRGVEAAARRTRYRLLDAERTRVGADWIATAHTKSDQAETVLLRLLTGRGTWRLSGILPETEDRIIRPLLSISRALIEAYLKEQSIEPRHDASNDDTRFLRNRIRRELMPLVSSWNPRIEELLSDTAALELERAEAFEDLLVPVRRSVVRVSDGEATIKMDSGISLHIVRMLILEQIRRLDPDTREIDAASLSAISRLRPGESRTISPFLRGLREMSSLILRRTEPAEAIAPYQQRIRPGERIALPEAGFEISLVQVAENGDFASNDRMRQRIQIDLDVPFSFELRNRRPGDRFRPLGMDRDKNLADFLIDRRIPSGERDSLPLLVCNDTIAWVTGVEVGHEFRVRHTPGRRFEIVATRIGGAR